MESHPEPTLVEFVHYSGVTLPELDVWGYQSAYPDRFDAKKNW